ncbi:MAG TPA: hypothetical protein VK716_03515 [Terracidiphilus sp.]|jgi:hypothetical protein|nr:hypothetical protein [Terracidiphilus sp.]
MATTNLIDESNSEQTQVRGSVLVLLPASDPARLQPVLERLASALPAEELVVAVPGEIPNEVNGPVKVIAAPPSSTTWTLTARDFVTAQDMAKTCAVQTLLILGPEAESLSPAGIRDLAITVQTTSTDLAIPRYVLPPGAGLVNSAILYPLSRSLFSTRIRFPLPIDLGLSMPMAERLANIAQRLVSANQGDSPLWVVNEAAVAGRATEEIDAGTRELPQPKDSGLNVILPLVTASLFSDIEGKAAFWQRARITPPAARHWPSMSRAPSESAADVSSMIQAFRIANTNLQEIWSLILPPNSMLGLKRLARVEGDAFRMPDQLWARVVFDFLIAYRLRTLNRGHLLGALVPLYLGWVAGHINSIVAGGDPERHIEALATAFETDKAYLVSRWRWPDRFNP